MGRVGPVRPSLDTMARKGLWPTPVYKPGGGSAMDGGSNSRKAAKARGMWPTPKSSPSGPDYARANREGSGGDDLATAVARTTWPTPTAGDGKSAGSRNLEGSKAHPGVSLTDAVQTGNSSTPRRWPMPQARDWKSGATVQDYGNSRPLSEAVSGQLNPEFVEWLMGFEVGWTDLGPSETASSRKSPSTSADDCWTDDDLW